MTAYFHPRPCTSIHMTSTDLLTPLLILLWWFDLTMILISLYFAPFHFILWCLLLFIVSSISKHWITKHQTNNAEFKIVRIPGGFTISERKYRWLKLEHFFENIYCNRQTHIFGRWNLINRIFRSFGLVTNPSESDRPNRPDHVRVGDV